MTGARPSEPLNPIGAGEEEGLRSLPFFRAFLSGFLSGFGQAFRASWPGRLALVLLADPGRGPGVFQRSADGRGL